MLTRTQKQEEVAALKDKFSRATSIFVADYRGVKVQEIDQLRSKIRQGGEECEYRVTKNSLLKRAVDGTSAEVLLPHFQGPTAIAISYGDPVTLAKVLVDYEKSREPFELKGGYLDGRMLDRSQIATLATLPSLEQLRGRLVGLLQAPATKLARLLNEPAAQLARLVEARRGSLEGS